MAAAALSVLSLADQEQQCSSLAADVLHSPAILAATFSCLKDVVDLTRCSAVCKTWFSVLQADDIWRAVYLQQLPPPEDFEQAASFRQQFARLRGLLNLPAPRPTALKGSALCYNPCTGNLVSYNARQRMVSVQQPDGSIRSEVLDAEGAGSAGKPLLASSGSSIVVLAAFDGTLQLWDASCCQQVGVLGPHPSFIISLAASGDLVASTCSSELRLWQLSTRQCLFTVPIGLPMPSPVLEPHVAVCHKQQLLALTNSASPAPCSAVKVYSTVPAGSISSSSGDGSSGGRAQPAAAAAAGDVIVGSSTIVGASGALLLRELPVSAAADMLLQQGLLLVASCFHGRSMSSNTPYKSERPFTVVVQIWDTKHWQLTRMVSPRLWTDYPIYTMQGTPLISLTQGMLLCATLKSGTTGRPPSCCIHGWQLKDQLVRAAAAADDGAAAAGSLCLLAVNGASGSSSGGGGGGASASASSSGGGRQPEPFGEGAMALGRAAVAAAGGAGSVGVSAANTVMLAIADDERNEWLPLLDDTGSRVTVMLTTPGHLVLATEAGQVLSCALPDHAAGQGLQTAEAGGTAGGGGEQQQQQQQQGVSAKQDGEVVRFVHVGM